MKILDVAVSRGRIDEVLPDVPEVSGQLSKHARGEKTDQTFMTIKAGEVIPPNVLPIEEMSS